jgi:hypothetical protein
MFNHVAKLTQPVKRIEKSLEVPPALLLPQSILILFFAVKIVAVFGVKHQSVSSAYLPREMCIQCRFGSGISGDFKAPVGMHYCYHKGDELC